MTEPGAGKWCARPDVATGKLVFAQALGRSAFPGRWLVVIPDTGDDKVRWHEATIWCWLDTIHDVSRMKGLLAVADRAAQLAGNPSIFKTLQRKIAQGILP